MYLKSDAVNDARLLKNYWLTNTWQPSLLPADEDDEKEQACEAGLSIFERRRKLKGATESTTGSSSPSSERVDESLYIALRDAFDQVEWLTTQLCRGVFQTLDTMGIRVCKARARGY